MKPSYTHPNTIYPSHKRERSMSGGKIPCQKFELCIPAPPVGLPEFPAPAAETQSFCRNTSQKVCSAGRRSFRRPPVLSVCVPARRSWRRSVRRPFRRRRFCRCFLRSSSSNGYFPPSTIYTCLLPLDRLGQPFPFTHFSSLSHSPLLKHKSLRISHSTQPKANTFGRKQE